jgi:hypothetical protein
VRLELLRVRTQCIAGDQFNFDALTAWKPDWAKDPQLILRMLERQVDPAKVTTAMDPALRGNRDMWIQIASVLGGAVLPLLPPAFSGDGEIGAAAALGGPFGDSVTAPISDREIAALALVGNPQRWGSLTPGLQEEFQLAAIGVSRSAKLINDVPVSMRDNLAQLRDLVMTNVLALDELAPSRRAALQRAYPEVVAAREALARALEDLNIHHVERFSGNMVLLREILDNRRSSPRLDSRPIAVLIQAKADDEGAYAYTDPENLSKLTRHYRVMYYEAKNVGDFIRSLRSATETKPAEFLDIGGHGN